MTKILYRLWKKRLWPSWQVNFNHFCFWDSSYFPHYNNYIGPIGSEFLSWWYNFAKQNFIGAYELDRGFVRFMRWRDKKCLVQALRKPVYYVVDENNYPYSKKRQIEEYLQNRKIEYFMVIHQLPFIFMPSTNTVMIYGLNYKKLDLVEFKLKFGGIHYLKKYEKNFLNKF